MRVEQRDALGDELHQVAVGRDDRRPRASGGRVRARASRSRRRPRRPAPRGSGCPRRRRSRARAGTARSGPRAARRASPCTPGRARARKLGPRASKTTAIAVGPLLAHHLAEHVREAEQRVRRRAVGGAQRRQREERAVEAVRGVDEHEPHAGMVLCARGVFSPAAADRAPPPRPRRDRSRRATRSSSSTSSPSSSSTACSSRSRRSSRPTAQLPPGAGELTPEELARRSERGR